MNARCAKYIEPRGITVMETDLGERIQQLDNQDPSHMVVPAVHKLRADVAELFGRTIGTDPQNSDIHYLAESQRMNTRPYFVREKTAGMTGCNFAVAETGTVVVCTNEGNADLSANVPPLHIASIGIEKLIPRISDLGVFIRMLSRSALGSPITQYTSHFRAPRPGTEMHYILVDHGRSERLAMEDFWYSLKCIRCGACMNTCPVYRRSGGLVVWRHILRADRRDHQSDLRYEALQQPAVCIDAQRQLHERLPGEGQHPRADLQVARVIAERHEMPLAKRAAMKVAGALLSRPSAYRAAIAVADMALAHLPRFIIYNGLNAWGSTARCRTRPNRHFTAGTMRIGSEAMSSRDNILASIRANLPRVDRPLPYVRVRRRPACFAAGRFQRQSAPHGRDVSRSAGLRRHPRADPGEDRGRQGRVLDGAGNRGQP